jgi:hypothetical protein
MDAQSNEDNSNGSDFIGARDCLVDRIVADLRGRGYFLAQLDSRAGQAIIDIRWAAQLAGRLVGRRTRTYASAVGKRLPGMVTVIVAPVEAWSGGYPAGGGSGAPAVIRELLEVHSTVGAKRRPA